MEIKQAEGQTLLTLLRIMICALASLSVFGMYPIADHFFDLVRNSDALIAPLRDETGEQLNPSGHVYNLYYDEKAEDGRGLRHIFKQYYLAGSEGALGLVDSAGRIILEPQYEDIILLPQSYVLKQDGAWRFYSRPELELMSDTAWDNVEISRNEADKITSDLVKVEKDGLFGATDQTGNIVVQPEWEGCEINTYAVDWPIIRVQKDGRYGFINRSGRVIIKVRYDYAQLDLYAEPPPEGDGETAAPSVPVIYVCDDGKWGGIFADADGNPQAVDWQIEPTAEVLEDYRNSQLGS
ncbi:MAG: WG repeat-containing protein [Clostridia bacterium]|nr:WG repeat-containing protein [Clostridia bacterium]